MDNRRRLPLLIATLLACIGVGLPAVVAAQAITACDWEVGHPSDPDRVGPGVSSSKVDTERAMAACRSDLETDSDNPRLQYQLARAIVYHADRNGTYYEEGMVLDADLMAGFLDAAADQVSGYYENMLLGALRRELAGLASP